MSFISQLVGSVGARRLAIMGAIAVALLAGLAYVALPGKSGPLGYLYTDLDPASAQAIAQRLETDGVPFQLSPDGTAVMAPQGRLAELRMAMAGEQLGGKIGYEILDSQEPFGVSASREKLNETRAIEGELARSIESLQNVSAARVHLVMPERAIFAAEGRRATAAVTVKTLSRLSGENVQAIRYLVAASVPELSPESVSLIDQTGALLARSGEAGTGASGDADERQQAVEAKLRQQIESLLEPIVGPGKVRAEVAAVIDRDQTREEASTVDPDKQAIAKQVTVESTDESNARGAGGEVTSVSTQLPENAQPATAPANGEQSRTARGETSEDVTYENSRTSTVKVRPPGQLKRLTVAVMVDGGANGLPAPQVQRLQRLVENAVGFDQERGDSVLVESMKFSAADLADADAGFLSALPTEQLFSFAKLLVIAAIALLAFKMLKPRGGFVPAVAEGPAMIAGERAPAELSGPPGDGRDPFSTARNQAEQRGAMLDQEIALAEVDGRVKLSAIKRIGETVNANPAEATSVIRQWMSN